MIKALIAAVLTIWRHRGTTGGRYGAAADGRRCTDSDSNTRPAATATHDFSPPASYCGAVPADQLPELLAWLATR